MVNIDKVLKALCDPGIYQKLELLVFSIGKKKCQKCWSIVSEKSKVCVWELSDILCCLLRHSAADKIGRALTVLASVKGCLNVLSLSLDCADVLSTVLL